MNRIFLSLYVLIVFSIVLVGWAADKLWERYNPQPKLTALEESFVGLVKAIHDDGAQLNAEVVSLSKNYPFSIELFSLDDLANSGLRGEIESGETVVIMDDQRNKNIYMRVGDSKTILNVVAREPQDPGARLYFFLLIFFYVIIAVVIYFWVWPLSRDLKKLQNQTKTPNAQGVPSKVDIGMRSAVYPLASAHNSMADRLDELIASQKEMTSAVSHELRTPLARMKFALEMMPENPSSQAEKKLISLKKDVNEMNELITQLLNYAGYEQHAKKLNMSSGDMPAMVENILQNCADNAEKQGRSIVHKVNVKTHSAMNCEWHLMERAIHNVVQNAFRYAESLVVVTLDQKDNFYCVFIEDDGLGIPEEQRENVLNAFVRLREQESEKTSGFGLGLSIVKRILRWHGGSVEVSESNFGGAKFLLRWPGP